MLNQKQKKEVTRVSNQIANLRKRSNREERTPPRKIEEHRLDGFLEAMKNANLMAYLDRQRDPEDPGQPNIILLWARDLLPDEVNAGGAVGTFEGRAASLRCEQDPSEKTTIWFRKNSNTLVEVASGEAKRCAAMALAVNELLFADPEQAIRVLSVLSRELLETGWDEADTLQFLRAIAFASNQQFDPEGLDKDEDDADSYYLMPGSRRRTIERVLGKEKAELFRACLNGADRR